MEDEKEELSPEQRRWLQQLDEDLAWAKGKPGENIVEYRERVYGPGGERAKWKQAGGVVRKFSLAPWAARAQASATSARGGADHEFEVVVPVMSGENLTTRIGFVGVPSEVEPALRDPEDGWIMAANPVSGVAADEWREFEPAEVVVARTSTDGLWYSVVLADLLQAKGRRGRAGRVVLRRLQGPVYLADEEPGPRWSGSERYIDSSWVELDGVRYRTCALVADIMSCFGIGGWRTVRNRFVNEIGTLCGVVIEVDLDALVEAAIGGPPVVCSSWNEPSESVGFISRKEWPEARESFLNPRDWDDPY